MFKLLKHCGKVLLTGAVLAAEQVSRAVKYVGGLFTAAKKWAVGNLSNEPAPLWEDVKRHLRMSCFRELLFFVGGFVCIFVFDDARGDLTWFRRMITSVGDFFGNVLTATADSIQKKVIYFFTKPQEANEM